MVTIHDRTHQGRLDDAGRSAPPVIMRAEMATLICCTVFVIVFCAADWSRADTVQEPLADPAESVGLSAIDQPAMPPVLRNIADAVQDNYEKIEYWQGKMAYEGIRVYRGETAKNHLKTAVGLDVEDELTWVRRHSRGVLDFKIAMNDDYFIQRRGRTAPDRYVTPEPTREYTAQRTLDTRILMLSPSYQIEVNAVKWGPDGKVKQRQARKSVARPNDLIGDPRHFLQIGVPTWELLRRIANGLEDGGPVAEAYDFTMEKGDNDSGIYRLQLLSLGNENVYFSYTFEKKAGLNCTYAEFRRQGVTTSRRRVDFDRRESIFVPVKMHVRQYDREDGELRREMKYDFVRVQLNEPIPLQEFSVSHMGLKEGDLFVDRFTNKRFRYDETKNVLIAEEEEGKEFRHTLSGEFIELP